MTQLEDRVDPEQFGRYRLEQVIGRGGMGEVYRAVDTEKDRIVAVKRLLPGLANDAGYQARFRRESKLVAQLSDPHIIPIHDYGVIDGRLFIDMPLIRGTDVAELMAGGESSPERSVEIVSQTAEALDTAHAAGLVHRDVKPSNLLLTGSTRDFVYLVDFGIARSTGPTSQRLTLSGSAVGTLDYMAPERFDGQGDHRVDVYSLGCVLFELLTGRRPFVVDAMPALIFAHLRHPVPRPSAVMQGLPRALDGVVERAMAKDPDQRFSSAGDLAAAARHALVVPPVVAVHRDRTIETSARPPRTSVGMPTMHPSGGGRRVEHRPPNSTRRPSRLRRVAVAAAVVLMLLVGVTVAVRVAQAPPTSDFVAAPAGPVSPTVVATVPVGEFAGPVAVSPDGGIAYVASSYAVSVIDVGTGSVVRTIPMGNAPGPVVFSSDGATAYVATVEPQLISVIDVASSEVTRTITSRTVGDMALSPDGRLLYATAPYGDLVQVIDTESGELAATIPVEPWPTLIALGPEGDVAYISHDQGATISLIDLASAAVVGSVNVDPDSSRGMTVSPDGEQLYLHNEALRTVSVIDTASASVVNSIPVEPDAYRMVLSADARLLYLTNAGRGTATVVDTATETVAGEIPFGQSPSDVALSADGQTAIAVNLNERSVSIVDLTP